MTTGRNRLDQIVRGLDGVIEGPWGLIDDDDGYAAEIVIVDRPYMRVCFPVSNAPATSAHIARCSPDAIREIASYVAETEARATAAEATVAALAELLELFTRHYEPWMDRWDDDAESSTFSRHTFGDLRRARKALATIQGKEK